jgi:hypothetical protein
MLMALPTAAAIGSRAVDALLRPADRPRDSVEAPEAPNLPRFALAVLGATLVGFLLSSPLGIDPL